MTEIKLYKSPRRAVRMLVLTTLLVGMCYLLINSDKSAWIGWIGILFFGLGYPVAIYNLLDSRPQIIINEIGIFDRTTHKDFINWDIISGAYLIDVSKQKFICLEIDESFVPSLQNKRNFSVAMGFGKLNLSLGQINIDPEKFLEFICKMIYADQGQRTDLIKETPLLNAK